MTVLNTEDKQDTQNPQDLKDQNVTPSNLEANNTSKEAGSMEEPKEDVNWRAFREARKKDRAEKEAAEKRAREKEAEVAALKAAMEAAFSKSAPSPAAYQQYYTDEGNSAPVDQSYDEVIEKKVEALLAKKEEAFRQQQAEYERVNFPNRLKNDFRDFEQVCSQENIDYLDYHYPEIARPLGRLAEGYEKWHDIYHAVKKFVPNHDLAKRDSAKADMNLMKPKSMNTVSTTPPGGHPLESWKEQEERRKANWERMQRTIRGA